MKHVKKDVYIIIKEVLNINPKAIDPNMPWYELGAESFDLVELIIALREHFSIRLETDELGKITTLNQLIASIEKKVSK